MSTVAERLRKIGACDESIVWVGDRDAETSWRECKRGDWLIWLACRIGVDRRLLVRAACEFVREILHLVPAGEDRPRLAIEAAERWSYYPSDENTRKVLAARAEAAQTAWKAAAWAVEWAAEAAESDGASHARMADIVRSVIQWQAVASKLEQFE